MSIPPEVIKCYKFIDARASDFEEELREIIKIPNVSSDPTAKKDIFSSINWLSERLKRIGFDIELKRPETKEFRNNQIPPVILGSLRSNTSEKKTVLYYCHLDVLKVQWAQWETHPFEMTEKNGCFYGRGTAKMKGPLMCFIHAIEAYYRLEIEIPVNIKIICESMFEVRSRGLLEVMIEIRANFLTDVDCILLTDSNWIGKDYPCIVYGTRGVSYFNMTIEGPKKDLNSGDYGGIVREPMTDMLYILNNLIDGQGNILVPHFNDDVVPVTPEEEEFYRKIKLTAKEYRKSVQVYKLGHGEALKLNLMHVWRYPSLNIHYVSNSCEEFNLLNIPRKVLVRFSIRSVPNQTHNKLSKQIINHIDDVFNKLESPNKLTVLSGDHLDPWYEDHAHWNYEAANLATRQVYKEEASYIREGNGFPVVLKLRDVLPGRNILVLPLVNRESGGHSNEENISRRCYIEGTKLLVSYFWELNNTAKRYAKSLRKKTKSYHNPCN